MIKATKERSAISSKTVQEVFDINLENCDKISEKSLENALFEVSRPVFNSGQMMWE